MAVLIKKRIEVPEVKNIRALALIRMCEALAGAAVMTVWALYIHEFTQSIIYTGLISSALTLLSFVSFFLFTPLIERHDKGKLFVRTIVLIIIAYLIFSLTDSFAVFLVTAIALTIVHTVRITTFGIIIKDTSRRKNLARNEGMLYTFSNIGFVLGPLCAGFLASRFGYHAVFLGSTAMMIGVLEIFRRSRIKDRHIQPVTRPLYDFISFFRDRTRMRAYFLGGGSQFWWILIYLYIPLMLVERGWSPETIGAFFFVVALPLVMSEYYFSLLVHKIGFRKVFSIGYAIPALGALLCFFVPTLGFQLTVLILASFGLALLEPTSEAHFLNIVKRKETSQFLGPYNTTFTVNQFVAKMLPAVLLLFLPFSYVFLMFGIFMSVLFIVALSAKK